MEELTEVTLSDIQNHSKKHGQKATSRLLTILGQQKQLYDIVMSEGGQLLFRKVMMRMNELLDKTVLQNISDEELMEYKIMVDFINDSATILGNYQKCRKVLKGA